MKKNRDFREYPIWQVSVKYSSKIYKITSEMPYFERKGLCDFFFPCTGNGW